MAKQILIIGKTGAGKSTSLRLLPHEETFYIDADNKGLNWKGWRKLYSKENRNYSTAGTVNHVRQLIINIVQKAPHIKYIVIDTITNLLVSEEIHAMKQKGYDKWIDLAQNLFSLIEFTQEIDADITFIYLGLAQDFDGEIRLKTNGKKLEKIELESKFHVVILMDRTIAEHKYILNHPSSSARTPIDFLNNEPIVDADIMKIITELEEY